MERITSLGKTGSSTASVTEENYNFYLRHIKCGRFQVPKEDAKYLSRAQKQDVYDTQMEIINM